MQIIINIYLCVCVFVCVILKTESYKKISSGKTYSLFCPQGPHHWEKNILQPAPPHPNTYTPSSSPRSSFLPFPHHPLLPTPNANMVSPTSFTSDRNQVLNRHFTPPSTLESLFQKPWKAKELFLVQSSTQEQQIQHLLMEALKEASFIVSIVLLFSCCGITCTSSRGRVSSK